MADTRVTLWGALLLLVLIGWIGYELSARFKMARTHAHFAEAVRIAEKSVAEASNSHTSTPSGLQRPTFVQPRSTGE